MSDVLNEQTGFIIVSYYGEEVGVQLQGIDGEYTLILIDGVLLVERLAEILNLSV